MNKVELDVIQNEKGQLIVIDQDGRRLARVTSVQVKQGLDAANEVTVTFLQVKGGSLVSGNRVEYKNAKS